MIIFLPFSLENVKMVKPERHKTIIPRTGNAIYMADWGVCHNGGQNEWFPEGTEKGEPPRERAPPKFVCRNDLLTLLLLLTSSRLLTLDHPRTSSHGARLIAAFLVPNVPSVVFLGEGRRTVDGVVVDGKALGKHLRCLSLIDFN